MRKTVIFSSLVALSIMTSTAVLAQEARTEGVYPSVNVQGFVELKAPSDLGGNLFLPNTIIEKAKTGKYNFTVDSVGKGSPEQKQFRIGYGVLAGISGSPGYCVFNMQVSKEGKVTANTTRDSASGTISGKSFNMKCTVDDKTDPTTPIVKITVTEG